MVSLRLEDLGQQADLNPLLALLTLPVRPEAELQASTQQILEQRPDLLSAVLPMSGLPHSPRGDLGNRRHPPPDQLPQTRAAQILLHRGRQEGRLEGEVQGEANVTLHQLNRHCDPPSDTTTTRIQALPLEQLQALTEALLDFSSPADFSAGLANTMAGAHALTGLQAVRP